MTAAQGGTDSGTDPGTDRTKAHTWEGDPTQVWHCTTCGLVTTSTDTAFECAPRPREAPARGV